MKTNLIGQRPSVPPAHVQVAHESTVGRFAAWSLPAFDPARLRVVGGHGTSGSVGNMIAGKAVTVAATQLTGDVRGVPPRGKPV